MKKSKRPKKYWKQLVKALEHDLDWVTGQLASRANVEKALRGDLADAEARADSAQRSASDHQLTSAARGAKLREINAIVHNAMEWGFPGNRTDPVLNVKALVNGYKDECARVDELESRPFTATITFNEVDPELIKILTGETTAYIPAPVGGLLVGEHYSLEIDTTPLRAAPGVVTLNSAENPKKYLRGTTNPEDNTL